MPEPTGTGSSKQIGCPAGSQQGHQRVGRPTAGIAGGEAGHRGPLARPARQVWPVACSAAATTGSPMACRADRSAGENQGVPRTWLARVVHDSRRVPRRPARPQLDYLVLPPRRPLSHRPGLTVVGPVVRIPGSMDRVGCTCGNTGGRSRRYPFVWGHRSSQRRTGSQVVGRCGCIRAKDTLPWR
jgi:hypothetical protein